MLGEGGLIPFIRGQPRAYLIAQIQAYRDRRRTLLEMVFVADTLNDNEINEIAGYISGLKLGPHVAVDATLAKAGRQQLRTLHCQSCHGTGYRGEGAVARLAGQSPAYTAWEIRLIRSGSRHHPAGKPQTELKAMPEETIDAVANALGGMN
ncbi:MAG: c-type cytochrome [Burkholderiales bacterium]